MENSRLVYSTDQGRICPDCGRSGCECRRNPKKKAERKPASPPDGTIRIHREVKGRNGKTVTVVSGIPLADEALATFAQDLKRRCGTGGSLKEGLLLIQGDHRETLLAEIKKKGFPVKLAGG